MSVYHGNDLRRLTGGKKGRHVKVKRKYLTGRFPVLTTIGEKLVLKIERVRGGNLKIKVRSTPWVNVYVPSEKTTKRVKIVKVLENPASRDFTRRGIITKGAIVQTEIGKARITSRPGQDGVVNAVLIE